MRYVIQLVCWLLRFMDKSSEDRVDAYSAQSAFFIIMGFIPFVMLLLILLQYTPMTKEDVMTLLKVIFPEGFHAYLETLVGSVYTKSTALLSGTVITAVWACSKAMMSVSKGLNKIYDTKIRKNYFLARFRAALYIILLLISLILAMGLFVFGNLLHDYLLHYLPWLRAVSWLIISARTIGTILLLCMIFCAMYAWLPYKRQDFFSQLPGSSGHFFCLVGVFLWLFGLYRIFQRDVGNLWKSDNGRDGHAVAVFLYVAAVYGGRDQLLSGAAGKVFKRCDRKRVVILKIDVIMILIEMRKALKVQSSFLFSDREGGSSAENLPRYRQRDEFHTGAAFLKTVGSDVLVR